MALLLDTDVIIDHLRGHPAAVNFIGSLAERPSTAAIVVAELYAGVRDGAERLALDTFLTGIDVLPVSAAIAQAGGLYRRDYGKSHNVGLNDAIIAATAAQMAMTVVTLDRKHFPMLANVLVPYSKP